MWNNLTLKEWQNKSKPIEELIINASITDGSDKSENYNFSIGMSWQFASSSNYKDNKEREHALIGNHEKLLLLSVRKRTNNLRPMFSNYIQRYKNIDNSFKRIAWIPPNHYLKQVSNTKFIFSPPGNGVDCHRHYEALICGAIPIIQNDENMKKKYKNMPILWTKDYSEITPDYLNEKYNEFLNKKYDFSMLFLSNHTKKDQELIKSNGNYWCKKLLKEEWYR